MRQQAEEGGHLELGATQPGRCRDLLGLQRAAKAGASELIELVVHELVQDHVALVRRARVDDRQGNAVCDARRAVQRRRQRAVQHNPHALSKTAKNLELIGAEKVCERLLRGVAKDWLVTSTFHLGRWFPGRLGATREARETPAPHHCTHR